jgi:hypothetical protein
MSETSPSPNPQNPKELLERWLKRLRESQFSHYEAAKMLGRSNYILGIPALILSTFVGTSIFASLGKTLEPTLQIFVGIISVITAILSALQTFLGFSDRAAKHRETASRYGAARRRIEEILAVTGGAEISPDEVKQVRKEIDSISAEAPNVPDKIWQNRKTFK